VIVTQAITRDGIMILLTMEQMIMDFQVFQAAPVGSRMVGSSIWAPVGSGGLQRVILMALIVYT
jgi:hypothetical protein